MEHVLSKKEIEERMEITSSTKEENLYVLKQYCDENGLKLNVIIND